MSLKNKKNVKTLKNDLLLKKNTLVSIIFCIKFQ